MTHKTCAHKTMKKSMEELKKEKNKKQSIAISLKRVEKTCKYSKKEYENLEKNILEFLNSKPNEKIPLSHVIETRQLIEYYHKNEKHKKCKKLEVLLWYYIINAVSKKIEITDNIWNELKKIKKLNI